MTFEQLVAEALVHPFSGWDFAWLRGRWYEAEPVWNYRELVQTRVRLANALLDMGTGGGEFLASLKEHPACTYATEGYPPNITIAQKRLQPDGITVLPVAENAPLPLGAETFDLVINRHESFDVAEICRILQSPGTFLTQQVGPRNCIQLNQYLEAPWEPEINYWSLDFEKSAVEAAGLQLLRAEEQLLDSIFFDIGAVVYYLKVIEWQIPDFAMDTYYDRLYALHQLIERQGAFFATAHRYLIEAQKP